MHTSPSGKAYIGQTNHYKRRCNTHQKITGCTLFFRAIKKYGWDNFTHEILKENLTLEQANYWEEKLIKEHITLAPNGYNLRGGGDNQTMSESSKKLISDFQKEYKNRPEIKLKQSEMSKKRFSNPEERKKLSDAQKAVRKSPEVRQRMSETAKKALSNPEVRKKLSIASKRNHANKNLEEKRIAALKKALSTPEAKKKRSLAAKAMHKRLSEDKLKKQKIIAKEWNESIITEKKSFIPMLFSFMQTELF